MSQDLLVISNPRRRKKRAKKKRTTRRKRRTVRRRRNPSPPGARKRRRRNPSSRRVFSQANIRDVGTAAASGAAGAIALDVALGFLPLPANLKSGIIGDVTKAVGALGLGAVANMTGFVKPSTARDMTVGALTVQFTGIGRKLLGQFAPGIALSAYQNEDYVDALGYAGSGWDPNYSLGAYTAGPGFIEAPGDAQPGLGEYLNGYAVSSGDDAFGW